MKKIVIKEIDRLTSELYTNKVVSEYLIYLLDGDNRESAYIVLGEDAKKDRVNELLVKHFITNENIKININDVVEELALSKPKKVVKWNKVTR